MAFTNPEFIIDGIKSSDIGVNGISIVRIGDSEINTPWMGGVNIIEDILPMRDFPTFFRTELQPIEFEIKLSILDDQYNDSVLMELGKIFGQRKYCEFRTTDFLGKVFYIQRTSPINLITYGQYKGWFSFQVRNCAPYAFTDIQISTYDCSDASPLSPMVVNIQNKSNVSNVYGEYYYLPKMKIDLVNNTTNLTIYNTSDNNNLFQFTGLQANESIFIDNDLKKIKADSGAYILSKFNKNFLRLNYGLNILKVHTPCKIQFICQYPVYL